MNRVGQCIMTCPTTACYDGLPGGADQVKVGGLLRFFGDGYQSSKKLERPPLLAGTGHGRRVRVRGELLHPEGGGRGELSSPRGGSGQDAGRGGRGRGRHPGGAGGHPALPGGSGAQRQQGRIPVQGAPRVDQRRVLPDHQRRSPAAACPRVSTRCTRSSSTGSTSTAVRNAMRVGIRAACRDGVRAISAGNYEGKLGQHQLRTCTRSWPRAVRAISSVRTMVIETVVTTLGETGRAALCRHGSSSGARGPSSSGPTRTRGPFDICRSRRDAVVNVTDDVLLFAKSALTHEHLDCEPARQVRGAILRGACHWHEVQVTAIVVPPAAPGGRRADVLTRVVGVGTGRPFAGLCRAKHAVVEASILASRLRFLPLADIVGEHGQARGDRREDGRAPGTGGAPVHPVVHRGAVRWRRGVRHERERTRSGSSSRRRPGSTSGSST